MENYTVPNHAKGWMYYYIAILLQLIIQYDKAHKK